MGCVMKNYKVLLKDSDPNIPFSEINVIDFTINDMYSYVWDNGRVWIITPLYPLKVRDYSNTVPCINCNLYASQREDWRKWQRMQASHFQVISYSWNFAELLVTAAVTVSLIQTTKAVCNVSCLPCSWDSDIL